MKVSEISVQTVKDYARVPADDGRIIEQVILPAAKAHLQSYTGLSAAQIDELPDMALACLALCAHLYDHRDMSIERAADNKTVHAIIEKYCLNLL